MKAVIAVTLKPGVLDPQGQAIQRACTSLGYESIESVRQGKRFEVELEAASVEEARRLVEEISDKLLSNPVIENFEIESIG